VRLPDVVVALKRFGGSMIAGQLNRLPPASAQKAWLGVLCLALFMFIQTVSAHAGLHQLLHADADSAEHQCVVTLIASGHMMVFGDADMPPLTTVVLFHYQTFPQKFDYSSFDSRWQPERAPPFFFI